MKNYIDVPDVNIGEKNTIAETEELNRTVKEKQKRI